MKIINQTFQDTNIVEKLNNFYDNVEAPNILDLEFDPNSLAAEQMEKWFHYMERERTDVYYKPNAKNVIAKGLLKYYVFEKEMSFFSICVDSTCKEFPAVTFGFKGHFPTYRELFFTDHLIKDLLKKGDFPAIIESEFNPRYGLRSWQSISEIDKRDPVALHAIKTDAIKLLEDKKVTLITGGKEVMVVSNESVFEEIVEAAFSKAEIKKLANAYNTITKILTP